MKFSLSRQVWSLTGFTVFALGLVIVITGVRLAALKDGFENFERSQKAVDLLLTIKASTLAVSRSDPILPETAENLRRVDMMLEASTEEFATVEDAKQAKLFKESVLPKWKEYLHQFQSAIKIAETSPQDAMSIPDQIYSMQLAPMIQTLDGVVKQEQARAASFKKGIESAMIDIKREVLALILIAATVVVVFQAAFARNLQRRVRSLSRAADVLKSGDLSHRLPQSPDELGIIAQAVNGFIDTLTELLGDVRNAAAEMREDAGVLANRADTVSKHTGKQSKGVLHIEEAIGDMAALVEGVSNYAKEVAEKALATDILVVQVERKAQGAVAEMEELSSNMALAAGKLEHLENAISEVYNVSALISEIAKQTNLLALNAAIEAARAGEGGRGFSVVADEVRKLSERTAGATTQISVILGSLGDNMSEAAESMQSARKRADHEAAETREIATLMKNVQTAVSHVQDQMSQIARSADQQSRTANGISLDIGEISKLAEETEVAMSETRNDTRDLAKTAQKLDEAAAQFRLE